MTILWFANCERVSTTHLLRGLAHLEVGRSPTDKDLADELSTGVEHLDTVATPRIHITVGITMDTIGVPRADVCEERSTRPGSIGFDDKPIEGCRQSRVGGESSALRNAGIRNIGILSIGGECNA